MEVKELEQHLEQQSALIEKRIEKAEANAIEMSKKELESYKEATNTLIDSWKENSDKLQKQLDEQNIELQKAKDWNAAGGYKKPLTKQLMDQLTPENIAQWAQKGADTRLDLKTVGGTDITTAITSEWLVPFEENTSPRPAKNFPRVAQITPSGQTSRTIVSWYERNAQTGDVGTRARGTSLASVNYEYERFNVDMKFMGGYSKADYETLADLAWLQSEITGELAEDTMELLSQQLLSGDGTGNNVSGYLTLLSGQTFSRGGITELSTKTGFADYYACLRAAIGQVIRQNYIPNYIVIHPDDAANMDLTMASDEHYKSPGYATRGSVAGVPIVQTNEISAGTYLVGDFNKARAYYREGMEVSIWDQNDTDVQARLKTITAHIGVAFRIKAINYPAFVTDTFSNTQTALEAV